MDYKLAKWRLTQLGPDDHIEVQSLPYSVPYSLIHGSVDVCISTRSIEVFHRGTGVAAQIRSQTGMAEDNWYPPVADCDACDPQFENLRSDKNEVP